MDEWVFIKIRVDEVQIDNVRPVSRRFSRNDSTGSFGYYPVDPTDVFKQYNRSGLIDSRLQ
jgi:hypothetical protein